MSAVARNTPRTDGDTDRQRPMNPPAFPVDPDWLPYHPWPRRPAFPLPDGTVDAHCHVFAPGRRFPYAPERKYTPCDAGKEDLFRVRDHLGAKRNVIVQAACHGADNGALADAPRSSAGRVRGVATVGADVTDHDLAALHEAGVRGVRFNFVRRLVNKVACPDRLTRSSPPDYDDVVPFARTVVEEFPDRVLWGTDLPHPNLKSHMPDDGALVDFIPRIAPTEPLRRQLFVDNPARLYWGQET